MAVVARHRPLLPGEQQKNLAMQASFSCCQGQPPTGCKSGGGTWRRRRLSTAVRALLSKGDTAYCSIERADQQSAVSALRAYIRSCQVTTYRTSASCAGYSVFRNLLPSEFLSAVFSARKEISGAQSSQLPECKGGRLHAIPRLTAAGLGWKGEGCCLHG